MKKSDNKNNWWKDVDHWADTINKLRIVPRIMVTMYGVLFYEVSMWFMSLDAPTASQAAFISTITGAGSVIFGFYVNSGNDKT